MLLARSLGKTYRVADKRPGIRGTLEHLFHRRVRDVHAVRDVTFDVDDGEFVGFIGANGAGKTTTLKMASGLIRPSTGSIRVAGFDPFARDRQFLRQITLVMGQKQQLIWDLPTIDTLRINAAVYELSRDESRRRIAELAELLDVAKLLNTPVRKLSLGERMKCELLAALLHHPRVLFLDEPTLGLDINAQESIRTFLRAYNRNFGATVLLTSHYMADITALCPRVLIIHEGRLLYDGSLTEIVERLAPHREIELHLSGPTDRGTLETFGDVTEFDGTTVRLSVVRHAVRATVARLFDELNPVDLWVREPDIERVIAPLLKGKGGNLA